MERDLDVAIKYFKTNVSVGEIAAVRDLKGLGIKEPEKIIAKLLEMRIIDRGEGCYNLVRESEKK